MDGTVRVDYTLSANTSGIMDANGMPATDTYDYEWLRSGVLIAGAEGSDYTVVDADVGETLSVRVNFTDSAGFSESLRSAETSSVLPAILDHRPALTIAGGSANEEDGEITFTVTLGEVHGLEVSVFYVTVGGTAVAGDDYRATSGTVTFAPGETEKTIALTIIEDLVIEGDEEFAVSLFSPVNAVLGNSRASGTIGDSTAEAVFAAMADSSEIPEAGGNATVTVSIANGVIFDEDIAIYLTFRFSEATRGDDFTASNGSNALRLVAGSSSVSVELDALQDTVYEGNESIVTTVYGIATTSTYTRLRLDTTVTIIDDDELPVATLQLSEDSIAENGGLSTVTATLSGESSTENHDHGVGGGGFAGGGSGFHAERRHHPDHRRGGDVEHRNGDDWRRQQRRRRAGQEGDGEGKRGVRRVGHRRAEQRNADHRRRRCHADGEADSDAGLDQREKRIEHGDGDARPSFERGNHADGIGDGGGRRGCRRFHAEREQNPDHRRGRDVEHRNGDDQSRQQQRRRPEQGSDGVGERGQYAGSGRSCGPDADHRGRRGGADGEAGSDTGLDQRERRFEHGDR